MNFTKISNFKNIGEKFSLTIVTILTYTHCHRDIMKYANEPDRKRTQLGSQLGLSWGGHILETVKKLTHFAVIQNHLYFTNWVQQHQACFLVDSQKYL